MRNLLLTLRYDGTRYHGWQIQQNAVAVQQVFQDALQRVLGETPPLNHFLPEDMAVLDCREVDGQFHARYSCTGKEYVYKIWNHPVRDPFLSGYALHYWYPLDEQALHRAAQHYLGRHDFTSFCTLDSREPGDMTRCVTRSEVTRQGDLVLFTVAADGFLYNMVRIMVGTLLRVAQGKLKPEQIPAILAAKNRRLAGPTAPACGLYLNRVDYAEDEGSKA